MIRQTAFSFSEEGFWFGPPHYEFIYYHTTEIVLILHTVAINRDGEGAYFVYRKDVIRQATLSPVTRPEWEWLLEHPDAAVLRAFL